MAKGFVHILVLLTLSLIQTSCGVLAPLHRSVSTKESIAVAYPEPHFTNVQLRGPKAEAVALSDRVPLGSEAAISEWENSRLVLFLGVGEAPYDDGLHPNDLRFVEATGFSDSSVHLGYEANLGHRVRWFSNVYATRYQSQTLAETIEDGQVAWVTVGLRFAW